MAIYRCKMCGGDLNVEEGMTVCECEYCGSKQTVPSAEDEKVIKLYDRANRLRYNCEFDKAGGVYENIVSESPEEAEAYWGILLCNYGIEYVDDPATGDKIPTCHRSSFDSFMDSPEFEMVMENSDAVARSVYREQAKQIEELRKGIIEVSGREQPYDVFICYKETSENGERTLDSVLAQDVYDALTAKGYRVFFSRISLEDKLGTEYEPYIFAALNSAKVMLAFGTSYDYYNAVWVKNEWSRYLKLMAKDRNKHLIPCYKGIDAYDIPKEFAKLQAQDLGKIGAMQDLIRGIDKLFGKTKQAVKIHAAVQQVSSGGPNTDALLKRVFMFLKDGNWDDADSYCEKVLDLDPECAEAYLGKLMASLKVNQPKDLFNCEDPFDDDMNYAKAVLFGDDDLKGSLEECTRIINDRNENNRLKAIYDKAKKALDNSWTEKEYLAALDKFNKILQYGDSSALAEKCREKAEMLRQEKERKLEELRRLNEQLRTINEQLRTGKFELTSEEIAEQERLNATAKKAADEARNAERAISESSEAREADRLKNEIASKEAKMKALGLFKGKEKKELQEQLDVLKASLTSTLRALKDPNSESYKLEQKAVSADQAAKNYSNALRDVRNNRKAQIENEITSIYDIGDTIQFGIYNQGNGAEPIEWTVLDKQGLKVLLISKYVLDFQPYETITTNVTWERCTLRSWLNGPFLREAFSSEESAMIATMTVTADKNPKYDTDPGNNTQDKVFLLSIDEVNKYLPFDDARLRSYTKYAFGKLGHLSEEEIDDCWVEAHPCFGWWLRSPGDSQEHAAIASAGGDLVLYDGWYAGAWYREDGATDFFSGVRPALWINLEF